MLIEACNLIDQMKIADADAESGPSAGRYFDRLSTSLYEYMLCHMQFAPYRGSSTGVVATEGSVKSLPLASLGDFVRGRMSEAERQVEGLFESLLAEAFS